MRRAQVIRLREADHTYDEIAALTGLSRTGVFDICKRHAAKGADGLRDASQEHEVQRLIADKTPD